MAAKRIAKSMVDWAAFAERVHSDQLSYFRAFKSKSDMYVSKVHRHPEALPAIDFAHYREKLHDASLLDVFEKGYKAVTVPYPTDTKNTKSKIESEEKAALEQSKKFVADVQAQIKASKELLQKIGQVPDFEHMTLDMMAYYFPETIPNPTERPTFWPHDKKSQFQYNPHSFK